MSFVHTPGHTGPEKNVFYFLRGIIFICDLQMKTLLATSFMKTKAVTDPEKKCFAYDLTITLRGKLETDIF